MSLQDIARWIESSAAKVSVGGRTILSLDTNPVPGDWTHVTKVDPEGEKKLPVWFPAYLTRTSAVSIGGSRDVTETNTEETFELVTAADVPAFHEPSAPRHVTETTYERAEFLAVPEVLNGDIDSLVGTLGEGIEHIRTDLGPSVIGDKLGFAATSILGDRVGNFAAAWMLEEAVFEAYIIMNLDSAAAREANVTEDDLLTPQEAKARAVAAEYHLESELIYLEYSGTFGEEEAVEIIEAIDEGVSWSRIWYGGGLDSRENVNRILNAGADSVVVGDVFHDIATEEATLYQQAREEFDVTPEKAEMHRWLESQRDLTETKAARYLSTIPAVTQPDAVAARNLSAGLRFALALRGLADELDDPGAADIQTALEERTVPGSFDGTDGDSNAVHAALARTLLGAHFGLEDTPYPPTQFALEL
jgi:phosphoglycerol geranylgeranyltransferase